jgi:hypothetical protein
MRTLLLCFLLLHVAMAFAGDHWRWVKATNTTHGWSVSQGDAEVRISGEHFEAKLFSDSGNQVISSLQGTIQKGNIAAKERVSKSDFSGSTYRGTLARKSWPELAGTTGAESITLSDGWGMIGLQRSLQK